MTNVTNTIELCKSIVAAGKVAMLHGSPGQSKSTIAKLVADHFNLILIDIRLSTWDPVFLTGMPDTSQSKVHFKPMVHFPLKGEPIPEGKSGWFLFFDELTTITPAMQAAAYRVILDREVGDYKLHPSCAIMAAGNKVTDGAVAGRMGTAMQTRMMHIEVEVEAEEWCEWAISSGVDHRVISYINAKPDHLHVFNPKHNDYTYRNPRTWDMLSSVIKPINDISHKNKDLIEAAIGTAGSLDFIGFCQVYTSMPSFKALLADPEGVSFSDAPNVSYALTGVIASQISSENADTVMKFIPRLGIEFQVLAVKLALKRDPELLTLEPVDKWVTINASRFY